MSPPEALFHLETQFHRTLRIEPPRADDTHSLHSRYALQEGSEPLLRVLGSITAHDVKTLREQLKLAAYPATRSTPEIRRNANQSAFASSCHNGLTLHHPTVSALLPRSSRRCIVAAKPTGQDKAAGTNQRLEHDPC